MAPLDADQLSRARAAMWGLALGDALGMPTQDMTPGDIAADYGELDALLPAGPRQRIAAGAPAGMITDDTHQALIVARLLAVAGRVDPHTFSQMMLTWESAMATAGSLDLLGPTTKRALLALHEGQPPERTGITGTTNGAAMRIAAVGILARPEPLDDLIDQVYHASYVTHATSVALAGAAGVAAAVSAGIDGATRDEAITQALHAARAASDRGVPVMAPDLAIRTQWAIDYLNHADDPVRALYHIIGTSMASHESVVAALAISATVDEPWQAIRLAARAGGDTDTVAAITGAITGATSGMDAWPAESLELVREVNRPVLDDVDLLVDRLYERRVGAERD